MCEALPRDWRLELVIGQIVGRDERRATPPAPHRRGWTLVTALLTVFYDVAVTDTIVAGLHSYICTIVLSLRAQAEHHDSRQRHVCVQCGMQVPNKAAAPRDHIIAPHYR